MIERMDSFLGKGIAVMDFTVKHSMYQIGLPDNILHKLQIFYVTESFVGTMQGAQHTYEVWTVYLKYLIFHFHHFGTIKVDKIE